ncbi:hypothetical protein N7E81_08030 [Reichenbachiella carrageenanivorans]|uniref:Lipoprotein n=1 Tax=Reichenbachiella carrageenanivorans TaxID=2979869 RepID=A0ABY6D4G4_9BACT|nr:hypothetical protein [Reichenbachiella carrageenanivorans]UXX81046.1 hypothetical protein N7E81_08030 [Reichenbachiella carrageenanivorans]
MRKLITYLIAGISFMVLGCIIESMYADAITMPQQNNTAIVQNK